MICKGKRYPCPRCKYVQDCYIKNLACKDYMKYLRGEGAKVGGQDRRDPSRTIYEQVEKNLKLREGIAQ